MPLLYPYVSQVTASIKSGSYLTESDANLFIKGSEYNFWYGTSNRDSIEVSVYDLNEDLISWKPIENIGTYETSILTYYDNKNKAVSYEYTQFIYRLPIYKTEKVLVEPLVDISSSNLSSGNYIIGYQFVRYLCGTPTNPLVIKEISPSKTELKLIPYDTGSVEYNAFCLNKIALNFISPLYLRLTKDCQYDKIYQQSKKDNESQISLIKNIFFISSDGKFLEFLKSIYEDDIKYSGDSTSRINAFSNEIKSYHRIQGIKTYFDNFLVSETNGIYNFDEIKARFDTFVMYRLNVLFSNFQSDLYKPAKNYLFEVFTKYYFDDIHKNLKLKYEEKFQKPLKNALAYNDGKYIPILTTAYIDERVNPSDPLTLLVKLQNPLDNELSIKSECWVSNISTIPFLFNAVIKDGVLKKTFKISSPDFTTIQENVSLSNSDDYYNKQDLDKDSFNISNVDVSKKIQELNVDYSSFNNFVVFSSAELRHNIFKNKMISLAGMEVSLTTLETNYSSSGFTYPYYTSEKTDIQTQQKEVISSFDGYESYLYKTGYYNYSINNQSFYSSSFVENVDFEATNYDKRNRDSLVNNTPEHIVLDSNNDDYLVFLSMIGHYFDNLYLYIKSLPSQRSAENNNSFSKTVLHQMLQSFGWKIDASLDSINISNNYLDTDLGGSEQISAEDRTKQVWNRILNTLPLIYKTKGTEECVRIVLSCYGIPSTLVNIREFGGIDYTDSDKTSYTIEEKLFMLTFKGYREYLSIPFDSTIKTIEMKVSVDPNRDYVSYQKIPIAVKYGQYNEIDWTVGIYKEPQKHVGRAYFELGYPSYTIGIIGDYGIFQSSLTQSLTVANSVSALNPDIILTVGNNVYQTNSSSYDDLVGRFYRPYINPYVGSSGSGAIVQRFFPAIGSSDRIGSNYDFYSEFFPTTPRFYTFKKGNVEFFVLNSDESGSPESGSTVTSDQANWLKSQITSSYNDLNIIWRIAVFNQGYISSGNSSAWGTWMDWGFENMGIDCILNGHDHFYERLEDGIPIIIQGAGGSALNNYSSIHPQSKFRYNNTHAFSVLESRGNKLVFSLYDLFGNKINDTGSTTLTSCSIVNGSFVMEKSIVPFSDRPFRQSDKYILSDTLPIFNGDVFNIMVRKNEPDELFEYNPVKDLIPTKYDLWVQRKDDSRTIFSSYKSDVLTQTYNYKFSNLGSLYFGNYDNSSSFVGQLDKILIWDTPITDHTFDDHCNNINSYSYTGSAMPYDTLYFRMNFDYPQNFSQTNPYRIVNQNEQYSSSIWMDAHNFGIHAYSSSIDNCIETSHSVYPYQFKELPYSQTFTITSYGPNKFKNQKVQRKNLVLAARLDPNDRSTHSPNRFVSPDSNQLGLFIDPNDYKNKDIFRFLGDFGVTSLIADPNQMFDETYVSLKNIRDTYNRSGNKKTYYNEMFMLYKFYFDKSIFETISQLIPSRNNVLSGILIEPTVLERPKYQYKKLSSDAMCLESTSSVTPSFTTSSKNVRTPSLSLNNSVYAGGNMIGDFISADFQLEKDIFSSVFYEHVPFYFPEGSTQRRDSFYKEYVSLAPRLKYVSKGWVKKYPDVGEIGVVESHPDWPVPFKDYGAEGPKVGKKQIDFGGDPVYPGYYFTGSGYYYLNSCYFYSRQNQKPAQVLENLQKNLVSPIDISFINQLTKEYPTSYNNGIICDIENPEELGVHCDTSGKIIEPQFSGSNGRFLIKNWIKDSTFVKKGEVSDPQTMSSQSLFLYSTEIWNGQEYGKLVYTKSVDIYMPGNALTTPYINEYSQDFSLSYYVSEGSFIVNGYIFHHPEGTFKIGPGYKSNNFFNYCVSVAGSPQYLYSVIKYDGSQYYETATGYSRNHLTHKKIPFGKTVIQKTDSRNFGFETDDTGIVKTPFLYERWVKSQQTQTTTVNKFGLSDNSLPVQTVNVSNINVVKTDNVLS